MKLTTQSVDGTSFHHATFRATVSELTSILGEPADDNNSGTDKVNFEWVAETSRTGRPVTVYDWKEYRPLDFDEEIEWHIGGHTAVDTFVAKEELEMLVELYRKVFRSKRK